MNKREGEGGGGGELPLKAIQRTANHTKNHNVSMKYYLSLHGRTGLLTTQMKDY